MVLSLTACTGGQGGPVNGGGSGSSGSGSGSSNVSDNSGRDDSGRDDSGNDDNGGASTSNDGGASSDSGSSVSVGDGDSTTSGSADSGNSASSEKKFKADWEGIWLPDSYSDFKGYLNVEAASDGNLKFSFITDDRTLEYSGEEKDYDEANYEYGSYISAHVYTSEGANFNYSVDPDYTYLNFDGKAPKDAENDENMWIGFTRFTGGFHIAPDGYDDSDRFGMMSRRDPDDETYFYADTDDYILSYSKSSSLWDGNDSVACEEYTLTSFIEDGIEIGTRREKYVFDDAEKAKKCYEYQKQSFSSYDNYWVALSDNIVYEYHTSYNDTTKLSMVYNWYIDCHYAFSNTDSTYLYYYYINKPITSDIYTLSLDDILYYKKVYGGHHSLDSKDASMNIEISKDYSYIYVSDYGSENTMRGSGRIVNINGKKVYTVTIDNYYNWISSNNYQKALIIQEFDFDTDVCTVTEYQYVVDDPTNCGINLSNFRNTDPDATIVHRFDMTKTIN